MLKKDVGSFRLNINLDEEQWHVNVGVRELADAVGIVWLASAGHESLEKAEKLAMLRARRVLKKLYLELDEELKR